MLCYNLYSWITFRISLVFSNLFTPTAATNPLSVGTSTHTPIKDYSKNALSTGTITPFIDNSAGLAAHHMFKLKFFIDTSNYQPLLHKSNSSVNLLIASPVSLFLSSASVGNYPSSDFTFSITSLEAGFVSSLDKLIPNSTDKITLSQNNLSQLHTNPQIFQPLYYSMNSSLSLAKQYR